MFIQIQNVSKYFGNFAALKQINLEIKKNEFFVLLGPSGCGKTTLMRIISGFELPEEGRLLVGGNDFTYAPPQVRPTNMVFQSYAIFQNMSVFDNIAYGLRVLKTPKGEIAERVEKMLKLVDMWGKKDVMPENLSGGQRQRVALSRALIMEPDVLLLDEPLSALDAKLRNAMRVELIHLQERLQITFIMVTHDQSEALAIADRIAVMQKGEVEQVGTPEEIYSQPCSVYVADFIGEMNWFSVKSTSFKGKNIECTVEGLGKIRLPQGKFAGRDITQLGVRLENVEVHPKRQQENPRENIYFLGEVIQNVYYGNYQKMILTIPGSDIMISMRVGIGLKFSRGSKVRIKISKNKVLLFDY